MTSIRLSGPDEAVTRLKPGDRIYVNGAAGYPAAFMAALVDSSMHDLTIHQPMRAVAIDPKSEYANLAGAGRFRIVTDYVADEAMRTAVANGWASYRPVHTGETGRADADPMDWVVLRTGPLRQGLFNLGPFPACALDVIARAKGVIVEAHDQMPHAYGDNYLRADEVDCHFVSDQASLGLLDVSPPPADPVDQAIAAHVAGLVQDGATIQLGIGALPDAIGRLLDEHSDLGVHSELFGDALMSLCQRGVVNNSRKSLCRFRSVTALALGSAQLYEFVHENSRLEFHPISWVNSRSNVSANPRQTAINSALEVDLLGQVASESIGSATYSGSGGQWEFHRGALDSPGGKGIVALHATTRRSHRSRISSALRPGTAVTIPRNDADIVVTEHGVAHLRGRDMRERAAALIRVAAPEFREELTRDAAELYGIRLERSEVSPDEQ